MNDGGVAFPTHGYLLGMTLRDYFAAAALMGIHASYGTGYPTPAIAASEAYLAADAMLAHRKATTPTEQ